MRHPHSISMGSKGHARNGTGTNLPSWSKPCQYWIISCLIHDGKFSEAVCTPKPLQILLSIWKRGSNELLHMQIYTHFRKIAHLSQITYCIYETKSPTPDLFLLELELQIRRDFPRVLVTYYNKCLYHFILDHLDVPGQHEGISEHSNPSDVDLGQLYPQLIQKHRATVTVSLLANPQRPPEKNPRAIASSTTEDQLAFANLSFLKAVKKLVFFNLSTSGALQMFGNYSVTELNLNSGQCCVIQIDPFLVLNGDLMISISRRGGLSLYQSKVIEPDQISAEDASTFAIYVIPSGLRCHFLNPTDISANFTTSAPRSGENLLKLLMLCTGVDYEKSPPKLWVKLIPNLQHLNNQTSKISEFVHDVKNKKYIIWPWELCLLQLGSVERVLHSTELPRKHDILDLVSAHILNNISYRDQEYEAMRRSKHLQPLNTPRQHGVARDRFDSQVTGESKPDNLHHDVSAFSFDQNLASPTFHDNINTTFVRPELSAQKQSADIEPEEDITDDVANGNAGTRALLFASLEGQSPQAVDQHYQSASANSVNDYDNVENNVDDDLFGDSSQVTPGPPELVAGDNRGNEDKSTETSGLPCKVSSPIDHVTQFPSKPDSSEFELSYDHSFISIPKEKMISADIDVMSATSYDDPGAPPAFIPTPIVAQTSFLTPHRSPRFREMLSISESDVSTITEDAIGKIPSMPKSTYMFSPLLFNPIIKSNIDIKYDRGGKFYVAREEGGTLEQTSKKTRETSVQGANVDPQKLKTSALQRRSLGERGQPNATELKLSHSVGSETDRRIWDGPEEMAEEDIRDEDDIESDEDELSDIDLPGLPLTLNSNFPGKEINENENARLSQHFKMKVDGLSPDNLASSMKEQSSTDWSPFTKPNTFAPVPSLSVSASPALNMDNQNQKEIAQQWVRNYEDNKLNQSKNGSLDDSVDVEKESSNCLPLILRSVNISSIPSLFLLPDRRSSDIMPQSFNTDLDDDLSLVGSLKGNRTVLNDLDDFLAFLIPILVFNPGITASAPKGHEFVPALNIAFEEQPVTDEEVPAATMHSFNSLFPLNYQVKLSELFLSKNEPDEDEATLLKESNDELEFLEALPGLNALATLQSNRKSRRIFWDTFYPENEMNSSNRASYVENLLDRESSGNSGLPENENISVLGDVSTIVRKADNEIINLNEEGLAFWKYLSLKPVNGLKKFQVLMISENLGEIDNRFIFEEPGLRLFDIMANNFADNHFGSMTRLHLDSGNLVEGVSRGLLLLDNNFQDDYGGLFYQKADERLKDIAELIKLDLIHKTNNFEFDRPLLLLFLSSDKSHNSLVRISKLCRNFLRYLRDHQLLLIRTFGHALHWRHLLKDNGQRRHLRYLSGTRLFELSKILYNKCPNNLELGNVSEKFELFAQISKEIPAAINFKFSGNREGFANSSHADLFLHVAYERTIDKNWLSAAWSDPYGIVTKVKAWYCSKDHTVTKKDSHDLGSVIGEIWETSNALFRLLCNDKTHRSCGSEIRKFLVLTRISSIIPDEELIFWKRYTAKHKDISLIVLSTSKLLKLLFLTSKSINSRSEKRSSHSNSSTTYTKRGLANSPSKLHPSSTMLNGIEDVASIDSGGTANPGISPSGHQTIPFQSPQTFLSSSYLSPQDSGNGPSFSTLSSSRTTEETLELKKGESPIFGVIPKVLLPSSNCPTRIGMKLGYLIHEPLDDAAPHAPVMAFEVALLSCSTYWNIDALMQIILKQYRNLILVSDIMGIQSVSITKANNLRMELTKIVPWHINAVSRILDYLSHIHVDEPSLDMTF